MPAKRFVLFTVRAICLLLRDAPERATLLVLLLLSQDLLHGVFPSALSLAKCRDDSRSSGVGTSKFFPLCEETEERKQAARVSCSLPNLSGTKGAPAPGLFPTSDRARGCRHHGCHHHGCRRRRSRLREAWLHSP